MMNFKEISEIVDYLSIKFDLIQQFRTSKQEASIELINILKDLDFELKCAINVLNKRKTINNWKYCKKGKQYIEGQIKDKEKTRLIRDEVISIDFDKKIVRTNNFAYNLGNELKQQCEDKK